ncbi:hypothetical protein RFI_22246, partial [Reticulomyxa filosa]
GGEKKDEYRYLYLLRITLEHVHTRYPHLFDLELETPLLCTLLQWCSKNDNEAKTSPVNVEMNAAKLLCRMLLRRKQWIEIESIHYQEVDPCIMEDCLHVLHVHNIVQLSKHDLVLTDEMNESLLQCLTKSRLKSVIQTCSLNNMSLTKFNALNRSDMTQCIVQQLNKQTTLFGTKIMHSKQFIQVSFLSSQHSSPYLKKKKKKINRVLLINLNHNNNNNDKEISGEYWKLGSNK